MARRTTVTARIEVEDRASGTLGRVRTEFGKLGDQLRSLPLVAGGIIGAVTGLTRAFVQGAKDALEYQKEVQRLENALGRVPGATDGLSKSLQEQADALSLLSGQTDTSILAVQALIAQMGVAPDQIRQATTASLDLAAALGISLESAARNVAKTTGGFAGELGELIPELKELSPEALKSGEGIRLLAEKFSGATIETKNFGTQLQTTTNLVAEFFRALGRGVTESSLFSGVLNLFNTNLANTVAALESYTGRSDESAEASKRAAAALDLQGAATERVGKAAAEGAAKVKAFIAAMQTGQIEATAAETQKLADAFTLLGVESDRSVTEKLLKAEEALERIEAAYRSGEASLGSYQRAQQAFNEAQEEAKQKLDDSAESTRILTRAQQLNREAFLASSGEIDRETTALERNTAAKQANTQAGRVDPNRVGTTGFQFAQGKLIFLNGRLVRQFPDGRIGPV